MQKTLNSKPKALNRLGEDQRKAPLLPRKRLPLRVHLQAQNDNVHNFFKLMQELTVE